MTMTMMTKKTQKIENGDGRFSCEECLMYNLPKTAVDNDDANDDDDADDDKCCYGVAFNPQAFSS